MTIMMIEYVVLRLSPDALRGENVNIGIAYFNPNGEARVRITATLAKVRALDPTWTAAKQAKLKSALELITSQSTSKEIKVETLVNLGFCKAGELGFFHAEENTLETELRDIANQYISTKPEKKKGQRKSSLHKEMSARFKSMDLLGTSIDDLAQHKIVAHVPIPNFPDLRGDFVYKNGVYRITQTIDYRVSEAAAHQKITEACTKSVAALEAAKVWGQDTKKFALVCVPPELANIADSHLDLLFASNFEIFHADNEKDLARYHSAAFSH